MTSDTDLLRARRELLATRATLQRVRVANELQALREQARLPRLAAGVLGSARAQPILTAGLVSVLGRGRLALVVRVAGLAFAAYRIWREVGRTR
jgi:hypothetical protein